VSYIRSRIRCNHCRLEMNVAFGIVGASIIAEWPKKCPTCGLDQFTRIADDWQYDPHPDALAVGGRSAAGAETPAPPQGER
jgi:hypothetical protein